MTLPAREDVPDAETWDPAIVFDSPDDWAAAADAFERRLDDLRAYEGRATADGDTLRDLLDLVEELKVRRLGSLHLYAFLTAYVDTTDDDARERMARYRSLGAEMESAMGFLVPELRDAGRDRIETLVAETPGLDAHEAHLRRLLDATEHALPSATESALATLSPAFEAGSKVGRAVVDGDVDHPAVETPDGETVTVTGNAIAGLLQTRDREFRWTVHRRLRDALAAHRHGMATAYVERIRADCRLAEARGYDSALAMRLRGTDDAQGNPFPVEAYETVVDGIADRLDPFHRLHRARKTSLGVDDLHEWDQHVPLAPGDPPTVPYDEATDLILDSLEPLGEEYVDRLAAVLDERRVDVRQTRHKRKGPKALQVTSVDDGPFLALNYDGGLRSLYLFTHELGHAMNRVLAGERQRPVDDGCPEHVGEVASFTHEALLADHLADVWGSADARHAREVYLAKLPLYRAARGATFAHGLHEAVADGADPGPDALADRHRGLVTEFREPITFGDDAGAGWQRIDLTRDPYHAYLYAVGAVGSLAVADGLRSGALSPAEYRGMLAKGRSVPDNEVFAPFIDFTDEATVERGVDAYERRLDDLLDSL